MILSVSIVSFNHSYFPFIEFLCFIQGVISDPSFNLLLFECNQSIFQRCIEGYISLFGLCQNCLERQLRLQKQEYISRLIEEGYSLDPCVLSGDSDAHQNLRIIAIGFLNLITMVFLCLELYSVFFRFVCPSLIVLCWPLNSFFYSWNLLDTHTFYSVFNHVAFGGMILSC